MANNSKDNQFQEEEKFLTKYDRKVLKRNQEEQRQKKRKMAVRGTGIVVLAACVLIAAFALISMISKSFSYIKVDDKSISKTEFKFYYNQIVNNYSSMYSMYGLDTSQPLDKQTYMGELTWKDYFEQMATDELVRVKALIKDANANNFKGDVEGEYKDYIQSLADEAKENKVDEDKYFKDLFGDSKEDIEEYMKENILANLWYEKLSDDQNPTDEEIETYYQENKNSYDYVQYYVSEVTAEGVTVGSSSDEEIAAAMEKAKTEAEALLGTIEVSGQYESYAMRSDISTTLSEWLFAEERVENETTVIEDSNAAKCYALKFVSRARDKYYAVNLRVISTSEEGTDPDTILAEWEAGEKTEDNFIKLFDKYGENTSVEEGLLEDVTRSDIASVEGLSEWLDEGRKEGDVTALKDGEGNGYVIYYKGESDLEYKISIRSTLINQTMQDYVSKLAEVIKVADPNGVLKYLEQAGE